MAEQIRYFVNGRETDRGTAFGVWLASPTYRQAALKDSIFPNAENGTDREDVRNHLAEAGVRIELEGGGNG